MLKDEYEDPEDINHYTASQLSIQVKFRIDLCLKNKVHVKYEELPLDRNTLLCYGLLTYTTMSVTLNRLQVKKSRFIRALELNDNR